MSTLRSPHLQAAVWAAIVAVSMAMPVRGLAELGLWRPPGLESGGDKVLHALAFMTMGVLLARSFGELEAVKRPVSMAAVLTLGFSYLLEAGQTLIPWRSFEGLDLVADTVGVALALPLAAWIVGRKYPHRITPE